MDPEKFQIRNYPQIFQNLKVVERDAEIKSNYLAITLTNSKAGFHENDIDILIGHCPAPYNMLLYCLPKNKLKFHDCLADGKGFKGKRNISFFPFEEIKNFTPFNWTGEFLLYRNDPNFENRLRTICNKQRNDDMSSMIIENHIPWDFKCTLLYHFLLKRNISFSIAKADALYRYLIYEKRVQQLSLRKNNVLWIGKGDDDEYRPWDFDAGFCMLQGKYSTSFLLIPMFAFKEQLLINIYESYKKFKLPVDIEDPTLWFHKYLFKIEDTNICKKLEELLNICIPEIEKPMQKIFIETPKYTTSSMLEIVGINPELPIDSRNRYIIGESSLESMQKAVSLEYHQKIRPLVSEKDGNSKEFHMERYGSSVAIFAINNFNYGRAEICADGCASDILYYEKDRDQCIGIQVKTTSRYKGFWSFGCINKGYTNLLMYFRSLEEGMSWLIPYQILRCFYTGQNLYLYDSEQTRIDWSKYLIQDTQLAEYIHLYYMERETQGLKLQTYTEINKPVSITAQKEHTNRQIFKSYMDEDGITVESPPLENMVYDILLMGMKTQEKTARLSLSDYLDINISKHGVPYHESDIHHMLIHCPEPYEDMIYLLPTDKLKEHGQVETDTQKGELSLTLCPAEDMSENKVCNWTAEFMVRYMDPNRRARILAILDKQRRHDPNPIKLENFVFVNFQCRTLHELMFKFNIPFTIAKRDVPYKYLIYGIKFQELTFTRAKGDYILRLIYSKDNEVLFYHPNDFHFAFVPLVGRYSNYFYLFPMEQFEGRNIIGHVKSQGERKITLDIHTTVKADQWALQFLFCYDDLNYSEKFHNLIRRYTNLVI